MEIVEIAVLAILAYVFFIGIAIIMIINKLIKHCLIFKLLNL